jgi:hypothetical protein
MGTFHQVSQSSPDVVLVYKFYHNRNVMRTFGCVLQGQGFSQSVLIKHVFNYFVITDTAVLL